MKRDCSTCICKEGSCYPSTTIFDKDKTCKSYSPDYEGYIAELEKEKAELIKENKVLAQNLEDTEILNKTYEKRFNDLGKENAELKKNYEDSLVACGLLKNKVELLSQPSPIESMQDALITTQKAQNEKQNADILTLKGLTERQRDQLTKAKELLKWALHSDPEHDEDFEKKWSEAEQFLKETK